MKKLVVALLLMTAIALPGQGKAEIPLAGYFIAEQSCPAYRSFKKGTNPGNVNLTLGVAYEVMAKNRPGATHYRVRVRGAAPEERWVSSGCGKLLVDCRETRRPAASGGSASEGRDYLLALSWQPAFCQNHRGKRECKNQERGRYDASNLSLHGLWPQPREAIYCDVPERVRELDERREWKRLDEPGLSDEAFDALVVIMPGVASYLHRHEWIKHGVCYGGDPEEYFGESIMLTRQVNASPVRALLAANIGGWVTVGDIKAQFDAAFGDGAGDRVEVRCDGEMVSEIWINLKGEIDDGATISGLMRNAPPAREPDPDWQNVLVDAVGY